MHQSLEVGLLQDLPKGDPNERHRYELIDSRGLSFVTKVKVNG